MLNTLYFIGKLSTSINQIQPPYEVLFKGKYLPFSKDTQSSQVNVTMTIDQGTATEWSNYVTNKAGFAFGYVVYNPRKGTHMILIVERVRKAFMMLCCRYISRELSNY